jgi:hypothetical protein
MSCSLAACVMMRVARVQQNQTPASGIFRCSRAKSNQDPRSGIEMANERSVAYARATQ